MGGLPPWVGEDHRSGPRSAGNDPSPPGALCCNHLSVFPAGAVEGARAGGPFSAGVARGQVDVFPVTDPLAGIAPNRREQDAPLEIIDTHAHSSNAEVLEPHPEEWLLIEWPAGEAEPTNTGYPVFRLISP